MCGIAGLLNHDPGAPADGTLTDRMRELLAHRGPDGFGTYRAGPVALAHRRLAVIDVEGGVQPLLADDRPVAMVYNGEVYNFRELRKELAEAGHAFHTDCDTEVVLAAYLQWGSDFARRLNGMFALAIWDGGRNRLLLARDRLGIKPLYLLESPRRFAFASEIKALRALPEFDSTWDEQSIHDYFHFRYVPGPRTAYRAVRQVPPGCLVILENGTAREERYWELRPGHATSGDEALAALEAGLQDAVALRTVSDVPIGAFLSGGIDSGLVVAFMSEALGSGVNTFTVFDPQVPRYDERALARKVADRYHTHHRELVVASESRQLLPDIAPTFDQPFADSGAFPNLVVCREGRRLVTVALSGLGGDELAAGYTRYAGAQLGARLTWVPRGPARWLAHLADRLPEDRGLAANRIKRFSRLLGLDPVSLYTGLLGTAMPAGDDVFRREFAERVDRQSPLRSIAAHFERADELGLDSVNRLLYTDLLTYIPDDLLVLADRTSMRVGLEVRVPFLDHRLVEAALAMPGRDKLRGRRLKQNLRQLARRRLPPELIDAPKRGFSVPMAEWLRGPLAAEMTRAVDEIAPATGVLERSALRRAWEAHQAGRANHEELLWSTLMFSLWAEGAGG